MKSIKRIISIVVCLVTLLSLCACGNQGSTASTNESTEPTEATVDPNAPLCDGKTLKILAITSSFGLNTTQFLYDIAIYEGATNVVVARLYASGCTLEQHVNNAINNTPAYTYTKIDSGLWKTTNNVTMEHGLKDEDWDIIFTQQGAAVAGQPHTYQNYVDRLIDHLDKNKTNPNARYVWNMTWAYQADTDQSVYHTVFKGDQMYMYNEILNTVKTRIVPKPYFSAIIPSGTAIQNARTSYFGDTLTKDTYHLNNLGRVIAGYTLWSILTGKELTEVNLGPVSSHDLPEKLTLSDSDRQVIIECVNNAVKNPWEVTPSTYTQK